MVRVRVTGKHSFYLLYPALRLPGPIQKFGFCFRVRVGVTGTLKFPYAFLASPSQYRGSSRRRNSTDESGNHSCRHILLLCCRLLRASTLPPVINLIVLHPKMLLYDEP